MENAGEAETAYWKMSGEQSQEQWLLDLDAQLFRISRESAGILVDPTPPAKNSSFSLIGH